MSRIRIAVVDDDESVLLLLQVLLDRGELEIVTYADPRNFLAQGDEYDVIVLDLMMPQLSGFEVLEELRQRGDRTPVIVLSALTDREHVERAMALGADRYLTKPFRIHDLLPLVWVLVGRAPSAVDETVRHALDDLDGQFGHDAGRE